MKFIDRMIGRFLNRYRPEEKEVYHYEHYVLTVKPTGGKHGKSNN